MGVSSFYTYAFGDDVMDAFTSATAYARRMHGENGYTGTIAEKTSFEVIPEDEHKGKQKIKFAEDVVDADDERIADKRGPAGAINVSGTKAAKRYRENNRLEGKHGNVYLFFGFANE